MSRNKINFTSNVQQHTAPNIVKQILPTAEQTNINELNQLETMWSQ